MRLITSLSQLGEGHRVGKHTKVQYPIGVRHFIVGETLQSLAMRGTGFADAVEACERTRPWVKQAVGRMALVYRRESGRVIAQFYHDPSGEMGCAVYSREGILVGIQEASLFGDILLALREDRFGKLGLLFTRWYATREASPSIPLPVQLQTFLLEAHDNLARLLRRGDKDIVMHADQEVLQEVAHALGASAALTLLQENYPFEKDMLLVENVHYPLAIAIDVLLDYYSLLLERMDSQDDMDLLDLLWRRPFQSQENSAIHSLPRGDVRVTGAQWEGVVEALLVACKRLCPKLKDWRQVADSLSAVLSADEQPLLRGYRRVRGYYLGPFPEENDGQAVSWEGRQQRMERFSTVRELAHLSVEEFALLDAGLLALAEEQDVRSMIERSIKDSDLRK